MRLRSNTVAAALVSPFAGGASVWAIAGVISGFWTPITDPYYVINGLLSGIMIGIVGGIILGLPAMLLLGLPIHGALLRFQRTSLECYAIAGGLSIATAMVIFGIPGFSMPVFSIKNPDSLTDHITFHVWFGTATGAATAAVFWLIRRPDRDARS